MRGSFILGAAVLLAVFGWIASSEGLIGSATEPVDEERSRLFDTSESTPEFLEAAAQGGRVRVESKKKRTRDNKRHVFFDFQTLGLMSPEEEIKTIARYARFRKKARTKLLSFQRRMDATKLGHQETEAKLKKRLWTMDAVMRCIGNQTYLTADPKSNPDLRLDGHLVFNDVCLKDGRDLRLLCPLSLADNPELRLAEASLKAVRKEISNALATEFNSLPYKARTRYFNLLGRYHSDRESLSSAEKSEVRKYESLRSRFDFKSKTARF